nr:RNA-directed DNA polymerase, eukaryota [Tanacetum cinerariifolium]
KFNGHETSSKKASWVQWNKVLVPKDNGGLGVSSLYALNRGLMFKWVWRRWPRGGAEVSQIEKLKNMIDLVSLKQGKDSWVWSMNTSDSYNNWRIWIENVRLPNKNKVMLEDSYDNWRIWTENVRLPNKNKVMLEGIFFVTWWLLWNFRNKKIFEGKSPYKAMFLDDVICKSFYWCRYRSKKQKWNSLHTVVLEEHIKLLANGFDVAAGRPDRGNRLGQNGNLIYEWVGSIRQSRRL